MQFRQPEIRKGKSEEKNNVGLKEGGYSFRREVGGNGGEKKKALGSSLQNDIRTPDTRRPGGEGMPVSGLIELFRKRKENATV